MMKLIKKGWNIAALLFAIILFVWIYNDYKNSRPVTKTEVPNNNMSLIQQETPLQVTAKQLYSDYTSNEVAADEVYKGRKIELTGIVESINKDFMNDPYLSISAGDYNTIHCSIKNKDDVMQLRKGQKITLLGTGGTMIIGIPVIDNCIVIR